MLIHLLTADLAAIGRIDPSMLDDQSRIELFFTPDDYKASREALKGSVDDTCTWIGIECTAEKRIAVISWHSLDFVLAGTLSLSMLPPTLQRFNLFEQLLAGEIETRDLPPALESFCVQDCLMTGTVDASALPVGLRQFVVVGNKITEISPICNFPAKLLYFSIREELVNQDRILLGKFPSGDFRANLLNCQIQNVEFEDMADERFASYASYKGFRVA